MRFTNFAHLVLLLLACSLAPGMHPAPARADDAQRPRMRFAGQLGGTPVFGTARYEVAGRPIDTDGRDGVLGVFDLRTSAAWLPEAWLAAVAELSLVNWQTEYLEQAAHERSKAYALTLSPEFRLKFGRRPRAPSAFFAPRAGVVFSRLSGSLHAEVPESERSGVGGIGGAGLGLEIPFVVRFGLRLEFAYEAMILKHHVKVSDLGYETRRFTIMRPLFLVGLWWKS